MGHATLRWETRYFRDRFLVGLVGFAEPELAGLEGEFAALARAVAAQPLVLVHRDLQAENVMVAAERPRLVDVQGLRQGPLGYDVAALVHDPYVPLPEDLRARLLGRWREGLRAVSDTAVGVASPRTDDVALAGALSGERWRLVVVAAGLQRLMQALGAFAYLGRVRGKRRFLAHVPAGLARLQALLDAAAMLRGSPALAADPLAPPELPRLRDIVARCLASGEKADDVR
jgi:aminoglycoside/choline kinase family phosphotransferase